MMNSSNIKRFGGVLVFRGFFILNLFLIALTSPMLSAQENIFGEECTTYKLQDHSLFGGIPDWAYEFLADFQKQGCEKLKNSSAQKKDQKYVDDAINALVLRLVACDRQTPHKPYTAFLMDQGYPKSAIFPFQKFCNDTYDPNKWAGIDRDGLNKKVTWLYEEMFCQAILEAAYPTGWFSRLFVDELPSDKKLQKDADEVCKDLRDDKILLDEAIYRWQQALERWWKRIKPEIVKKSLGGDVQGFFKKLFKAFK